MSKFHIKTASSTSDAQCTDQSKILLWGEEDEQQQEQEEGKKPRRLAQHASERHESE